MVWFKVDDKFHGSDPVKRIPREHRAAAIGLWTLAGAWSSDHLKDGFVPTHIIEDLGGSIELADILCVRGVKLWHKTRDGYRFNDWEKWQRTRAQVEEVRAATAKRVADHRAKRTENTGVGIGDVTSYKDGVTPPPTRPDPTTPKGVVPHKRGTRITDPFIVTADMRRWAATGAPAVDVDRSTEKFVNFYRAATGRNATALDWPAKWRNWLMNDADRNQSKPTPTQRAERTLRLATELDTKAIER